MSVSEIVTDALCDYLRKTECRSKEKISLTVAEGGGWIGPSDPRSNAELFDLMNLGLPIDQLR